MTEVIKASDCTSNIGDYDVPIYNAIIIPQNATNGDAIKAMFPNVDTFTEEDCPHMVNISLGGYVQTFRDSWWNAPYKAESEDNE